MCDTSRTILSACASATGTTTGVTVQSGVLVDAVSLDLRSGPQWCVSASAPFGFTAGPGATLPDTVASGILLRNAVTNAVVDGATLTTYYGNTGGVQTLVTAMTPTLTTTVPRGQYVLEAGYELGTAGITHAAATTLNAVATRAVLPGPTICGNFNPATLSRVCGAASGSLAYDDQGTTSGTITGLTLDLRSAPAWCVSANAPTEYELSGATASIVTTSIVITDAATGATVTGATQSLDTAPGISFDGSFYTTVTPALGVQLGRGQYRVTSTFNTRDIEAYGFTGDLNVSAGPVFLR